MDGTSTTKLTRPIQFISFGSLHSFRSSFIKNAPRFARCSLFYTLTTEEGAATGDFELSESGTAIRVKRDTNLNEFDFEVSERALRKTRILAMCLAKWLQTLWLHPPLS